MLKIITFLATVSFLSACGGGGGGSANTPNTTPVSSSSISVSSSSNSSASSIDPCNNTSGTIFGECLNKQYGYIVGSQYSPTYVEYTTSQSGEQVQWSILDGDNAHNKVLDVRFTDNSRLGQITIGYPDSAPATRDLSEFQTGTLTFDINVKNFGDAFNPPAGGAVFVARMDCVWPCAAHETPIILPTLDTWTTVSLPIRDLIATGLDISKISASLVLVPRGNQANLHIQLDNVMLTKGGPVQPSPKLIYKEDFNQKTIPAWSVVKQAGNPTVTANTNNGFGATLTMLWQGVNDSLRFETILDKAIDMTNKHASFQISCWKDTVMDFSFQMTATDVNGNTATTDANYATLLKTDTWYTVKADFGSVFPGGYDPKQITKIGVQFNYLGSPVSQTACQVDTIRITE